MLGNIRELMRPHMQLQKRYPYWMSGRDDITLKDRLMMICLMIYYMQPDAQVRNYTLNMFSNDQHKVKKKKIDSLKPAIDSFLFRQYTLHDEAIRNALTNDFLSSTDELKKSITREADVEQIALKLYEEYFE